MERVILLIEATQERLACLLNPETLEIRRLAGIEQRTLATGALAGAALGDAPLIATGGGRTELRLDLLFDVSLAGSSIASKDVRDLTRPFWRLAENLADDAGARPQLVHLIWGTGCDLPCVVAAAAERLDRFSEDGTPGRSWLRLRLLRAADRVEPPAAAPDDAAELSSFDGDAAAGDDDAADHQALTGGAGEDGEEDGERLDDLAARALGGAWLCRAIAALNGLDDLLRAPPGRRLRLPSSAALRRHRALIASSSPEDLAEA